MDNNEFFKISSGLKSLIGAELITDIYVAIFELVKNSFDAKAQKVTITFNNLYSDNEPASITIEDDGKGMNYQDLKDKWLFVAYSAKKDGSEDTETENTDYRHRLKPQRYYAGAKGVGRFSCDRLGRYLNLITLKDCPNSQAENLVIDWADFDQDSKEEFINIPVKHQILKNTPYALKHGTILKISGLYSNKNNDDDIWNRKSLLILKDRLSKLIRPDLNRGIESDQNFKIILNVPEELENDNIIKQQYNSDDSIGTVYSKTVNGEIKNFIFDNLNIKTTKISSIISKDGSTIETKLEDRGILIYNIIERNYFHELKDISIHLYFLNRSAKITFSKKMGIDTVQYGNIFVYKNGFRIYPYGERGDDSFRIDNRGMQGYNRFISLRNLIGQIDIQGNAENLYETTSRNGGLVKTKAFYELTDTRPYADSLLLSTLKKLEKYVVDVTDWGINNDEFNIENDKDSKEKVIRMLANILDSESVLKVNYNPDILNIVGQKEENSARKLISNFKRIGEENKDENLFNAAKEIEKKLNVALKGAEQAIKEKTIALKERDTAIEDKEKINRKLELKQTENLFLKSDIGMDKEALISLQHHISHTSNRIAELVSLAIETIQKGNSKDKIIDYLNKIIFENRKIATLSGIVSKANFDTKIKKINKDIVGFVNEYIQNVYNFSEPISQGHLNVIVKNETIPFLLKFTPIEIIRDIQ